MSTHKSLSEVIRRVQKSPGLEGPGIYYTIPWESKTIKRIVFRGTERELPLLQPVNRIVFGLLGYIYIWINLDQTHFVRSAPHASRCFSRSLLFLGLLVIKIWEDIHYNDNSFKHNPKFPEVLWHFGTPAHPRRGERESVQHP